MAVQAVASPRPPGSLSPLMADVCLPRDDWREVRATPRQSLLPRRPLTLRAGDQQAGPPEQHSGPVPRPAPPPSGLGSGWVIATSVCCGPPPLPSLLPPGRVAMAYV